MTESYSNYSQTRCHWCARQTDRFSQKINCPHKICDRCFIYDRIYKSNCPVCCYLRINEYVQRNKICAVCCRGIKSGQPTYQCSKKHYHCPECISDGCLLCELNKLNPWNDKTVGNICRRSQQVLYACQVWINQLTSPQSMSNDQTFYPNNRDDRSSRERTKQTKPPISNKDDESVNCVVCIEPLGSSYRTLEVCGHKFHHDCIDHWFESSGKQACPTCGHIYGISKGPQPSTGQMRIKYLPQALPGFENDQYENKGERTIEITYSFSSGIQGPLNPNPGQKYSGTSRTAYLPNNHEGKEILQLLRQAFDDQHIFTIGRSTTTGQENVVTWNDIHHKTSIYGGPERFGYPDPTYLIRVRGELADKGYK